MNTEIHGQSNSTGSPCLPINFEILVFTYIWSHGLRLSHVFLTYLADRCFLLPNQLHLSWVSFLTGDLPLCNTVPNLLSFILAQLVILPPLSQNKLFLYMMSFVWNVEISRLFNSSDQHCICFCTVILLPFQRLNMIPSNFLYCDTTPKCV